MPVDYPPVGFHFAVAFQDLDGASRDTRFQSVSGLSATVETEEVREGGENRFKHKLPTGTTCDLLELRRGLVLDSALERWCRDAIEHFVFKPINVQISLLGETHQPIASWRVVNAFPVRWSVSEFDAQQSAVAIETLQLQYQYFRRLNT
ncbi:MAG TPA: phage tail protein [Verrucomicrobiota bacterium]|nr:glycerol acyltransferase [Verrucomicrobiales bacterium]HRI12570.1 phage tail protein [Verrucomicrobiota bacterium]